MALPVKSQPAFDLNAGNAAVEVVIPAVVPIIYQNVSANAGDATLVLRVTTLITNAWYDATAPYHPTAVGVYSHLGRRPESQASNANLNVALMYASYQVLNRLLPEFTGSWRAMLEQVGLDPDDESEDITTAVGLGNVAGIAVANGRENDGMNQLGNEGPIASPAYSDYTGYVPVNTAYRLHRPSRWQPDIQRQGLGLYKVQQFVTPQYALVEPYSFESPHLFSLPRPFKSNITHRKAYVVQANEVLQASANLTEEQKLKAELFDNKIVSLGISAVHAALSQNLTLLEFIQLDFLTNMAAFDAGIFVWKEKRRHDAVRPFSAINLLYRYRWVRAWGGPGQGSADVPGDEWQSYLEEADHPEYPSASACFCQAHAQSARLFLGTDLLQYPVNYPAGSSRIEPGVTPASDTTLVFDTWTDLAQDCGQSRLWAGVHFRSAIDESMAFCPRFGDMAVEYMDSLIKGTAALRLPSQGRDF
ncbi:vanadium-dependent haloperoxidase [Halioxenophilus aromaticivorans]